ncbi:MAG: glycosyltransferase [Cyclobacteriaceae bacterium]|nr:glycosyltransferase [Cyclobacteriaceae bacterium]
MRVKIFLRKPRPDHNSIEELFETLLWAYPYQVEFEKVYLPCYSKNLSGILKNLWFAFRNRGDINHISGAINYIVIATGRNSLLTIHDAYLAVRGSWLKKKLIRIIWFKLPALIARRITTISEKSKKEIEKFAPHAKHKIRVIPNAFNPRMLIREVSEESSAEIPDKPIILHPGTRENKNLERTIRALHGLNCTLVIIGELSEGQKVLLEELNIDYKSFYNLPYLELADWYFKCHVVSFASTYEGFGMPIIEAQLIGRPVVTSDIEPMNWVSGDSACLVDPYNETSIRKGIEKVLKNKGYRLSLVKKGRQNVRRFEPHKLASMYMEEYKKVVS